MLGSVMWSEMHLKTELESIDVVIVDMTGLYI